MTGKNKSTGNDKIIQLPSGAAGEHSRASPCQAGNSLSCSCTVFGEIDKKLIMDTPVKICYSKTLI